MSHKLEAIANLFSTESLNTSQTLKSSITHMVNQKYNLSAFNDKHATEFIQEFNAKILSIQQSKKANKDLVVKDLVLNVFKNDMLIYYRNYARSYVEEVKKISNLSTETNYQEVLKSLQNSGSIETVSKLPSFRISKGERFIYPNHFARILERRVLSSFNPSVLNFVKTEISNLTPKETGNGITDIWQKYYGAHFSEDNDSIEFKTLIQLIKSRYDSYNTAVKRLIILLNQQVDSSKTN